MPKQKTAIIWFANNLRVRDNECLQLAVANADRVIAVYCFDPNHFDATKFGFQKTGPFRSKFLRESVEVLGMQLKDLNIPLITTFDHPHKILKEVCQTYSATHLYFQEEWTQEEEDEIQKVRQHIPGEVEVTTSYTQFLFHPNDIPFSMDEIPKVFGNFRRAVEKMSGIRPEVNVSPMPSNNYFDTDSAIPSMADLGSTPVELHPYSAFPFEGGEIAAMDRLQDYFFETRKLGVYKRTRNGLLGTDYSSKFSSWLANGSISAKTIYWKVKEFEQEHFSNQSTYWLVFELIWRDFFKYVSLQHGNDLFTSRGIQQKEYLWRYDEEDINSWIEGRTKEPFVNANMMELKHTGWMSNRGRQNVASYFARELQLDWRIGASYFESLLIDYDVHSNYGNWQYVAGVGNDPRNRKFNMRLQAERYDANHTFRNRWLQPTLF